MSDDLNIQDYSSSMVDNINESVSKTNKQYDNLLEKLPMVVNHLERHERIEQKLSALGKTKYSDIVSGIKNVQSELFEQEAQSVANVERIGDASYEQLDVTNKLLEIQTLRTRLESDTSKQGKIYEYEVKTLDILEEQTKELASRVKITNSLNNGINESVGSMESFFDKTSSFIDMIPGGGLIHKLFDTDNLKTKFIDTFRTKLQDNAQKMMDNFAETGKEGMTMFDKLKVGAQSFGQSLTSIKSAGLLLGIGLVAGALIGIIALANKLNARLVDTAKSLGISKDESFAIQQRFSNIANSSEVAFYNLENLNEATQKLNKEYGLSSKLTDDQLKTQILLTKQLDLSDEQAVKLSEYAGNANLSGEQYVVTIMAATKELNKQTGMQIAYAGILSDISDLSSDIYLSFGDNTQELVQSVYQAKLLGTNLNELKGVADNLMDIQSSISDEMEARVLTGKNLNFGHARELAMQGEYGLMQKEILHQSGGLAKIQGMRTWQLEAEAKAAGMTADAYTKMVQRADVLERLSISINDKTGQISENSWSTLEASAKSGDLGAQQLLKEATITKNSEKMAALKEKLLSTLMLLVPTAEKILTKFTDIVTGLTTWIQKGDNINSMTKVLAGSMDLIIAPIKWIVKGLTSMHSMLQSIFGEGNQVAGVLTAMMIPIGYKSIKGIAGGFTGLFKTISSNATGLMKNKMFKGDGLMGKLLNKKETASTTKSATKTFKGLTNLGKSFGSVITSLMKGIADGITKLFEGIQKAITSVSKGINDVLTNVSKGIGNVLTNISSGLQKALTNISKGIGSALTNISTGLSNALTNVSKGLSAVLQNISKGLGDAIMNISKGIGKGFEELMTSAGRGIAGFFKAFKAVKVGDILKGALALGVISGAVWLFAKAMKEFTDISWDTVVKAIVALGALTVAIVGLGILMSSGVGAVAIIAGAAAIGIIAGAMWVLGKAMQEFGKASKEFIPFFEVLSNAINEGITAIGGVMEKVIMAIGTATTMIIDSIVRLADVNVLNLLAIGPALFGIAAGLAALTGSSAMSKVEGFFGGSVFDKLTNIANVFGNIDLETSINGFKLLETIQYDYIVTSIDAVSNAYIRLSKSIADSVEQLQFLNDTNINSAITKVITQVSKFITPDKSIEQLQPISVKNDLPDNLLAPKNSSYNIQKNIDTQTTSNIESSNIASFKNNIQEKIKSSFESLNSESFKNNIQENVIRIVQVIEEKFKSIFENLNIAKQFKTSKADNILTSKSFIGRSSINSNDKSSKVNDQINNNNNNILNDTLSSINSNDKSSKINDQINNNNNVNSSTDTILTIGSNDKSSKVNDQITDSKTDILNDTISSDKSSKVNKKITNRDNINSSTNIISKITDNITNFATILSDNLKIAISKITNNKSDLNVNNDTISKTNNSKIDLGDNSPISNVVSNTTSSNSTDANSIIANLVHNKSVIGSENNTSKINEILVNSKTNLSDNLKIANTSHNKSSNDSVINSNGYNNSNDNTIAINEKLVNSKANIHTNSENSTQIANSNLNNNAEFNSNAKNSTIENSNLNDNIITNVINKLSNFHETISSGINSLLFPSNNVVEKTAPIENVKIDNTKIHREEKNRYTKLEENNVKLQQTNFELVSLFKEMLSEFKSLNGNIAQPAYIKIGDKTVNELTKIQTMKRNMKLGID